MQRVSKLASQEDKSKHRRRIQNRKKKERFSSEAAARRQGRLRSPIAKELVTNPEFRPRVVRDKRGKEHNLDDLDFKKLIEEIQKDEE